jgi:peptide/nickel transport system ATP-binding protein
VIAIRDGQTSSETVRTTDHRRPTTDHQHAAEELDRSSVDGRQLSQELVVLDSAGRLQLPGEQRELAGIGRRARVEVVDGGILIRPADDDRDEAPADVSSRDQAPAYQSLYSAAPPATNGATGNGKRGWWPRRAKRNVP